MIHMILAYLTLFCAGFAIFFGIYHYRINPKHAFDLPLEWIHIVFYFAFFILFETIHRLTQRRNLEFESVRLKNHCKVSSRTREITVKEFYSRIKQGEALCILDEYVLDIS